MISSVKKKDRFLRFDKMEMSLWDADDLLPQLVDDSDPDTDLDQFRHLPQTSEAIRHDGHPDWMVLVGLMHDMGKAICLFGEPQWGVGSDTFPVGCAFSDMVVYPAFFSLNPDFSDERYDARLEGYRKAAACGMYPCPGGTTNRSTTRPRTACRNRACTCSATTPFTPGTGRVPMITFSTTTAATCFPGYGSSIRTTCIANHLSRQTGTRYGFTTGPWWRNTSADAAVLKRVVDGGRHFQKRMKENCAPIRGEGSEKYGCKRVQFKMSHQAAFFSRFRRVQIKLSVSHGGGGVTCDVAAEGI
jgi:hypothetical protein